MTKWNRIDHQKCINWNLLTHESSHKITLSSTDSMTQAKRVVTLHVSTCVVVEDFVLFVFGKPLARVTSPFLTPYSYSGVMVAYHGTVDDKKVCLEN